MFGNDPEVAVAARFVLLLTVVVAVLIVAATGVLEWVDPKGVWGP